MEDSNELNIPAEEKNGDEMSMADLLGPDIKLENGKILSVKIIGQNADGFLVDLGTKSDGLIPIGDCDEATKAAFKIGMQVQVMVVKMFTESGYVILSNRQIREKAAWEKVVEAYKAGLPVEGRVRQKNRGGFTVDVGGVSAFCPISQIELRFVKDGDKYLGKTLSFLVAELDQSQRNVVLSRKKILEAEDKVRKVTVLAGLVEGSVVDGQVTGITDFGAFIDIGGMEGLLHIGDIAWFHVKKVSDVLKPGQKVTVQILKVDREKGKISFSLKNLSPRPWDGAKDKYPEGLVIKGKISSIADFGVFVELEPGLEGLIHQSEVSWDEQKPNLRKTFVVGTEIEAKIIGVDPTAEKLSLSLKKMLPNPWEEAAQRYAPGARVKGTVMTLTPFGAFVKLTDGIEGLIHVSDLSWTKKIRHPQDVLKTGDEIEVVVMEVNTRNEKMVLSLKHLQEDPMRKYKVGASVTGVVKRVVEFGAFVELEPDVEALVRNAEISARRDDMPPVLLKEGQTVEAKVIKCEAKERKIEISIRKLDHEQERALIKKYVNKSSLPTLGDMLMDETADQDAADAAHKEQSGEQS
ncbi:MAG: 30S ribosomal protein S1 [Elusimicrobia bacterium]|nr:30S ribosomal protein S1 [Elusimicrobiota bacterium]